jgi:hypothetical protein
MARPCGGRPTCEGCRSVDVRHWHREGRLRAGQCFPYSWTHGGEPAGRISVRTESNAVVLSFRYRTWESSEWKRVEQRVPIVWTACHLGGRRAWFRCTAYAAGHYCGRRVAKLYLGGRAVFACRHCYGLAYACQHEGQRLRSISRSRKIRMRLGGTPNLFDSFPEKPRRMHWRTYLRLRARGQAADALCNGFARQWLNELNWS